jgi:hypothetical protein
MTPVVDERRVVVVESRLDGFQHGDFNAALLRRVHLAYPEAQVLFRGETDHLEYVSDKLERMGICDGIEFETISLPARSLQGWRDFLAEFTSSAALTRTFARKRAKAVVFSNVTARFVLTLKILMWTKRFAIPTIALLHGEFSVIAAKPVTKRAKWIRQRAAHAFPQPSNLRLIVLGASILENLKRCLPVRDSQWSYFDHP